MHRCNIEEEVEGMDLTRYVEIVQDYPKPGISFKDITPLMDNGDAYKYATDQIAEYAREKQIDLSLDRKHGVLLLDVLLPILLGWLCTCS